MTDFSIPEEPAGQTKNIAQRENRPVNHGDFSIFKPTHCDFLELTP